ncbi:MAG: hypothetical protein AAGK17_00630 [Pseudomonadota bacterium]
MVARSVSALVIVAALTGCSATGGAGVNSADQAVQSAPEAVEDIAAEVAAPQPAPKPAELSRPPQIEYRELTLVRSSRTDAPSTITVSADEMPAEPTKILDPAMAERLFGNTGITLQWIGWEERGPTWVSVDENGYWMLLGGQESGDGGLLDIEGFITEIGPDYFLYDGTIKMFGTPDKDRQCNMSKRGWRFGITQNRKYWRLREFEWCDYLTDYIDIYF